MRRLGTKLIAAALLFAAGTPAFAADKVTLQLGWLPGGDAAPAMIGVAQGLFAKQGLDVTVVPGRGSTDTLTKVVSGVADIGEVGFDALLAAYAESKVPAKAILSIYNTPPDALFVLEDGPIKSLKDVAGKRVATSPFTSSNYPWPYVLKLAGVDPASVNLIKADPSALAGMLAVGKTDGVIFWVTTTYQAKSVLEKAGKKLRVLPWSKYGFAGYSRSLVASDKTIAEKPDVLRRFNIAYVEAEKMMAENPEIAGKSVKALFPVTDEKVAALASTTSTPLIFNSISDKHGVGSLDENLVGITWSWVAKYTGKSPDAIDPEDVVNRDFIPK